MFTDIKITNEGILQMICCWNNSCWMRLWTIEISAILLQFARLLSEYIYKINAWNFNDIHFVR